MEGKLRLQDALNGAVLLSLEDLVTQWRVFERHLVGLEVFDAQRVVFVVEERHYIVHPTPHVGLAHAYLNLHVEEISEREHLDRSRVDAGEGDGPATPDRSHTLAQGERPIELE